MDIDWLKQGGGFIKNKHAPAGRFNLGEKLVYWLSACGRHRSLRLGLLLLFPFYGTDIAEMQLAQVVHAVVAVLFVALILAHIYIGTLGMEGAFEAMGTGEVDLNWAKEHHDLWLARQLANARPARTAFGDASRMSTSIAAGRQPAQGEVFSVSAASIVMRCASAVLAVVLLRLALAQIIVGRADGLPLHGVRIETFLRDIRQRGNRRTS